MEETRLTQILKSIKEETTPRTDWVLSVRQRMFEEAEVRTPSYAFPMSYLMGAFRVIERPVFVLPVIGLIVFAGAITQGLGGSIPGDYLYSVRSIAEQTQLAFSSNEDKPLRYVELAQKRLEDLKTIAHEDKSKNLPSAIREFNQRMSDASKGVVALNENGEKDKALQAAKEVIQLHNDALQVEGVFGSVIGQKEEGELEAVTRLLVEQELNDLASRSLTTEQQDSYEKASDLYGKGEYSAALEEVWRISNQENTNGDE